MYFERGRISHPNVLAPKLLGAKMSLRPNISAPRCLTPKCHGLLATTLNSLLTEPLSTCIRYGNYLFLWPRVRKLSINWEMVEKMACK